MLTPQQLADADDEITRDIEALTASRRELYTIHRDDLIASGMDKADVLVEMAALKAAIAKRRKLMSVKGDEVRTKDDRTDEILFEIMPGRFGEAVDPATREIRDTAPPDLKPAGPTVPPVNHAFSAGESPSTPVGEAVQASDPGELEERSPRSAGKPAIRQEAAAAGDGRKASGEGEASSPRRALAEIAAGYTPTKPRPAETEEPDIPAFLRRGDPECVVKEVRS